MKKCPKCNIVKCLSDFHKCAKSKDGRQCYCKSCNKKYIIANYRLYGESEAYKKAKRKYRQSEKGKATKRLGQMRYQKGKVGKLTHSKNVQKYRKRHPQKRKAQQIVAYAIKTGKLPKANILKCTYCSHQAEQYHHPDYSKPLYVEPVCISCHRFIHKTISDLSAQVGARAPGL